MNLLRLSYQRVPEPVLMQQFVAQARDLLDSEDEHQRRQLEDALIAQLPALKNSGLFEVFEIRDPALRQMLADAGERPPRRPRLAVF
ncbi:hypothetical protein [Oleiagrimonas sp. C23AA]|uniref:hypothetical protein n=1 Tax=Oleiagrimonas sp. C23AA TaxID=2719047 RepID=UPI00141DDA03|nr:hypothetical protein [Oleiagrimonas sp. C23AA]NII12330.1 hypothetical protein [Oleiagrimonas sp. C23AA]